MYNTLPYNVLTYNPLLNVSVVLSDSSTGAEQKVLSVTLNTNDSGLGLDNLAFVGFLISLNDNGLSVETLSPSVVNVPLQELGTGDFLITINNSTSILSETGILTDSFTLQMLTVLIDSLTSTEVLTPATVDASPQDSGTGSFSINVSNLATLLSDAGVLVDSFEVQQFIVFLESIVGTDHLYSNASVVLDASYPIDLYFYGGAFGSSKYNEEHRDTAMYHPQGLVSLNVRQAVSFLESAIGTDSLEVQPILVFLESFAQGQDSPVILVTTGVLLESAEFSDFVRAKEWIAQLVASLKKESELVLTLRKENTLTLEMKKGDTLKGKVKP